MFDWVEPSKMYALTLGVFRRRPTGRDIRSYPACNRCPTALHRIFPSVSDRCWRGNSGRGDLFHMWWTSPRISPFWHKIFDIYKRMTGVGVPRTPVVALLLLILGSLDSGMGPGGDPIWQNEGAGGLIALYSCRILGHMAHGWCGFCFWNRMTLCIWCQPGG